MSKRKPKMNKRGRPFKKGNTVGHRFKPGESGNPKGRPPIVRDLRAIAREYTQEALDKIVNLMREADREETQERAAEELLSRGWGKPVQPTTETVEDELRDALKLLGEKLTPTDFDKVLDALDSAGGPTNPIGPIPTTH